MPDHLKALVVILVLAGVVFSFAKSPACARASTAENFERRRNLWFGITLAAFLAHNFWIFLVVAGALLLLALPREPSKIAMFFFLLFAVPRISSELGGLGIVKTLFEMDYARLLALTVLLPAFLVLRKQPGVEPFGRTLPDKLVLGFLIYSALLMLSYGSFTGTLRKGVFLPFIDIFLPYYVASRSLRNLEGFRDALMAFVVAALVLSAIGGFEFVWRWLLYSSLDGALGAVWPYGEYLRRGDYLRAAASVGHAIPLGYVIAVAIGFYLYLRRWVPDRTMRGLGLMLLIVGLIAPVSRGPWVGAVLIFLLFVATGPGAGLQAARYALLGGIALPVLLATPVGEEMVQYLPFVGTIDQGTLDYRRLMLAAAYEVFLQNPIFGSPNFIEADALQALRQGQGIIDLVNTYISVSLSGGVIGLALFGGFFLAVAAGIYGGMRSLADQSDERYVLGQSLLATLAGIMLIIFTVASISIVPFVYWAVAGLGVAYARMLAVERAPAPARRAGLRQAPARRSA